ncbi:hypothetical protein GCM10027284_42060 [Cyclobacterium sediminis]
MKFVITTPDELNKLISEAVENAVLNMLPVQSEPPKEIFLTRKEAAEKLRISLVTLNEYSKRGVLKSYLIGGRVLYKESELEDSLYEVQTVKY